MNQALTFSSDALQPFLRSTGQDYRVDLYIKGVRCGHCVHKIESEINLHKDIKNYQFESGGQRLSLWSQEQDSLTNMIRSIHSLGFETVPLSEESSFQEEEKEFKSSLKKLAVAGVCAGNIMLFSVAIYLGADDAFVSFFNKLSFALVIPVLLYSASSIWAGFYKSLSYRKFNLDLPIGLALLVGFVLSFYSLITGGESIYFDSLSVVVFLVLSSRFVLNRHVSRIYQKNIVHFVPGVYQIRKIVGESDQWVSLTNVKVKDQVKVLKSEVLPVDGVLLSDEAIVDQAVLTGESKPVVFKKGDLVYAGSRLCAGECLIEVVKNGKQTRVGQYIENAMESLKYGQEESFKLVSFFTAFVVLASFVSFVVLYFVAGLDIAFQRAFAIIIVACPCAVSFGIPLIRSFTGQLAIKNGIVIKKPQTLSQLISITNICLDKTGTLTNSQMIIDESDFLSLSHDEQKKLLALELAMDHPISNGFKAFADKFAKLPEVEDFKYQPGRGISGQIEGELWEVLSRGEEAVTPPDKLKRIYIYKNKKSVGVLRVESNLKKDLADFLSFLSDSNKKISILSGDEEEQVLKIQAMVPQKAQGLFLAQATPESKQEVINQFDGDCVMVGDGINDIAAMKSSKMSICMPGALENNMSVADASLTHGDLGRVKTIFQLAERVKSTETRLLGFTFVYNILCVALASLGYITPVAAAILMPISSLTVLTLVSFNLRKV